MEAILTILVSLCPSCDNLSLDNIVDRLLNCSTNQNSAYFKAAVVYSNPDGQSTASTLTSTLLTWLLTQEKLMIGETSFTLNHQCPMLYNGITEQACVDLLNSILPLESTESPLDSTESSLSVDSTVLTTSGFFAGLVAGIILMILAFALVAW